MTEPRHSAPAVSALSHVPPHLVLRDVLPARVADDLLAFAVSRESAFQRTGVGPGAVLAPTVRISRASRDLGPFRARLTARALELAPSLIAGLRLSPFDVSEVELQLVAHGDRAFYSAHIDTATATQTKQVRVLSAVYYFHSQPRVFDGGALRLYAIGDNARFIDVPPDANTLVAFPAWAPHAVMPVSLPGDRFADARFAINIWLLMRRAG